MHKGAEIWTLERPNFVSQNNLDDEANFKPSSHVNRHNYLYQCTENPNITMETELNQQGVCGGISIFGVLGHIFLKTQ
jgi:hypothetical protein